MKKKVFCAAALLLLAMASAAMAAQVRATGNVNVRSGPGLDYGIMETIFEGNALDYTGQTEYDDRGVAWYSVDCYGQVGWMSDRYSDLEGETQTVPSGSAVDPAPASESVEVSGYFMETLASAASALGLGTYYEEESEAPKHYTDGTLTLAGWDRVEYFEVTGPGYSIYGGAVGMDGETAKRTMIAEGLDYAGSSGDYMTFEHPASAKSPLSPKGSDGVIEVELRNGIVAGIDWSTYTDVPDYDDE